ncbi:hypothetical protein STA3757_26410 [Stanieria sp. NIES-3757]|nr:hypothetical protein STA3757_26410 [Stanieria sp. NIES-3757]
MNNSQQWYIIKQSDGTCQITSTADESDLSTNQSWGPFNSQADAIAKRIGLIRAGKCQPL